MLAALCMEGQKEPYLDNESEIGKIPKIFFLIEITFLNEEFLTTQVADICSRVQHC